jgi:hypothetical protein
VKLRDKKHSCCPNLGLEVTIITKTNVDTITILVMTMQVAEHCDKYKVDPFNSLKQQTHSNKSTNDLNSISHFTSVNIMNFK